MRRGLGSNIAATLFLFLVGCAVDSTTTAKFVEYRTLRDGTRVAVVAPVVVGASPAEIEAYVRIDDLEPADLVLIRYIGRDWDQPQWMPDTEVVARSGRR